MSKTGILKHIKFTPGHWFGIDYAGTIDIQDQPYYGERNLLAYVENYFAGEEQNPCTQEEAKANAKLIEAAPKMFWNLVIRAEETGEQYLYDLISDIIGHKITYDEIGELMEHACQTLQAMHKEEKAEEERKLVNHIDKELKKDEKEEAMQSLLDKLRSQPGAKEREEFGKFLMQHIDDLTPEEKDRYNELKRILKNIDDGSPRDCPRAQDDKCEECQFRDFEMVPHPGGVSTSQTEKYYCEQGHWEDDF